MNYERWAPENAWASTRFSDAWDKERRRQFSEKGINASAPYQLLAEFAKHAHADIAGELRSRIQGILPKRKVATDDANEISTFLVGDITKAAINVTDSLIEQWASRGANDQIVKSVVRRAQIRIRADSASIAQGIKQDFLAQQENEKERPLETNKSVLGARAKIVMSLHGIRTRGSWQKEMTPLLNTAGFVSKPLDFGFFSALSLVLPSARRRKMDWFLSEYTQVRKDSTDLPSIIAHSFGTYLVSRCLEKYREVKFDTIILCGSMVRPNFPWTQIINNRKQAKSILNDYGHLDNWVRLAGWIIEDAGPSGAEGFLDLAGGHVRQRQNLEFRHSDYFYELNYSKTWVPFLKGEEASLSPSVKPSQNLRYRLVQVALLASLLAIGYVAWRALKPPIVAAPPAGTNHSSLPPSLGGQPPTGPKQNVTFPLSATADRGRAERHSVSELVPQLLASPVFSVTGGSFSRLDRAKERAGLLQSTAGLKTEIFRNTEVDDDSEFVVEAGRSNKDADMARLVTRVNTIFEENSLDEYSTVVIRYVAYSSDKSVDSPIDESQTTRLKISGMPGVRLTIGGYVKDVPMISANQQVVVPRSVGAFVASWPGCASFTSSMELKAEQTIDVSMSPAHGSERLWAENVAASCPDTEASYAIPGFFSFTMAQICGNAVRTPDRINLIKQACWLKKHSDFWVSIEGHASPYVEYPYKYEIGEELATATKLLFIAYGVSSDQLRINAYADSKPISISDKYEERLLDARVMLTYARMAIPPDTNTLRENREVIDLNGLNFDRGKCEIPANQVNIVTADIKILSAHPAIVVGLLGHTSSGEDEDLGQCRAMTVANVLIERGVARSQIGRIKGYGSTEPIDSNASVEGRARNQRVEIVVGDNWGK